MDDLKEAHVKLAEEAARRVFREMLPELLENLDAGCVTYERAGEMLGVNEWRVRQMCKEGKLDKVSPSPGTKRVTLASIRRFTQGERRKASNE